DALARVELAKVVAALPDLHAAVRPLAGFTRRVLDGASQRGGEPDALPEHERLGRGHLAPPFTRASAACTRRMVATVTAYSPTRGSYSALVTASSVSTSPAAGSRGTTGTPRASEKASGHVPASPGHVPASPSHSPCPWSATIRTKP